MNEMYGRIESLCKQKGVNVTQMCRDAGVPRGNLTDLKNGRTAELSTKNLTKIAAYFSVPLEALIGESIKKQPTVNDDELSDNLRVLIEFAKTVPEDKAEMVLRVLRSIVESD